MPGKFFKLLIMARVRLSPLLTSIQGSVGNATFQKSQGGYILRTKPFPSQSYSLHQYRSKYYFRLVQKAWHDLSDVNRQKYINYVKLRPASTLHDLGLYLSPYNLFLKYNIIRLHAGLDILESIYFDYSLDSRLEPRIGYLADDLRLVFNYPLNTDNKFVLIKFTSPIKPTHYNNYSKLRVFPAPNDMVTTGWDITEEYEATFYFFPEVGDVIFCDFLLFNMISPCFLARQYTYITVETFM